MCQPESIREVLCTVRNARQATQIVKFLEAARFARDEISVEFPPPAPTAKLAEASGPASRIHVSVETESLADVHRACESFEEAGAENIEVLPRFAGLDEPPAEKA